MVEVELQSILDQLNVGGNIEQQKQLTSLAKYQLAFATEEEDLGYTDQAQPEIHLTDDVPVVQPYRWIPWWTLVDRAEGQLWILIWSLSASSATGGGKSVLQSHILRG